MAFLLLVFSTVINIMYGVYFRKPPVYFHTYIDETGTLLTEVAMDDAMYDYASGVEFYSEDFF